ncbi:hypothetical protein E2C01_049466 [Portunus trituberculatus]|uniref:Uncharacterized protein n=1 Tax=Portunus trituberculatus TaxID=210409 RepID=A0A5B7GD84_PORTR|nr:hypothetical protein [Portunus trituberculatus]
MSVTSLLQTLGPRSVGDRKAYSMAYFPRIRGDQHTARLAEACGTLRSSEVEVVGMNMAADVAVGDKESEVSVNNFRTCLVCYQRECGLGWKAKDL